MRILVRISGWAIWARRLGNLALPLAVLPVLMHRIGAIATDAFEVVEALAILAAVLALVLSLGAFVRIWITGDRGWGRAVTGLLSSLVCLAPLALFGFEFATYPLTDEVTTDPASPPALVSAVHPVAPTPAVAARLAAAFPNVRNRNYPLAPADVFAIVDALVADRGWDVLQRSVPDDQGGGGRVNALATSLFGFRDEVAIRLLPSADGTTVAVRSTSLTPLHEPGVNGNRIESFLTALDASIADLKNGRPAGTNADSGDDDTDQAPVPAPAPFPRLRKK